MRIASFESPLGQVNPIDASVSWDEPSKRDVS